MFRGLLVRSFSSSARFDAAKSIWKKAQAVCFDVDSTVISSEGIDELAKFAGVDVSEITRNAMNGGVKFEDAFHQRLQLIKPTVTMMKEMDVKNPAILSPHVDTLVAKLHEKRVDVFLVSGGMKALILPVAARLSISPDRVIANVLFFDAAGRYTAFDKNVPTSRDGGKAEVVRTLKSTYGYETVVMIGDGATDMQARPPASLFVGYGGNVVREKVRDGCDWWVTDFRDLIAQL